MLTDEESSLGAIMMGPKNHCVFCLTKLCKSEGIQLDSDEDVPAKKRQKRSETHRFTALPVDDLNRLWKHVALVAGKPPVQFQETTPLCESCESLLLQLDSTLKQFEDLTHSLQSVMIASKGNGQLVDFLAEMRETKVEENSRCATLKFLEKVGHEGISEDENRIFLKNDEQPEPGTSSLEVDPAVTEEVPVTNAGQEAATPAVILLLRPELLPTVMPPPTIRTSNMGTAPQISTNKSCDICRDRVPPHEMLGHIRSHVGDYCLTCPNPNCGWVFGSLFAMLQHKNKATSCKPFYPQDNLVCEVCSEKMSSLLGLRNHLNLFHEKGSNTELPCPMAGCSEKFSHRQSVECHISLSHTNKRVKNLAAPDLQTCLDCRSYFHKDRMRFHLENIHKIPPDQVLSCQYCPYLFPSRTQLVDHFQAHIVTGLPVGCDLCPDGEKYITLEKVRLHYFEAHQVGSQVVCEHCNKPFWDLANLKGHMYKSHGDKATKPSLKQKKKLAVCPDCGKEYSTQRLLASHRIIAHGADPYKCKLCDATFTSEASRRNHENEHKGVASQLVTCDIPGCGKTYNSSTLLERHKLSVEHAGRTNQFVCKLCGKGYNTSACLKSHQNTVHPEERKFVCDECGDKFKTEYTLNNHKLIHTGERPFQCSFCGQRFRQQVVLKRHVTSHEEKGDSFKPNGPAKNIRKRVKPKDGDNESWQDSHKS